MERDYGCREGGSGIGGVHMVAEDASEKGVEVEISLWLLRLFRKRGLGEP